MADNPAKNADKITTVPVLPLRDIVVFPHMIVPLFVGREKSVRALEEVINDEKQILLLTQKNAAEDDPTADGLHSIGTCPTRPSASWSKARAAPGSRRSPAAATISRPRSRSCPTPPQWRRNPKR
jgi:hypothetical protein